MLQLTGVEHRVASAYHPQTNGLTERFNQTLKDALIQVVNERQNDWDQHLDKIMFSYRYEAIVLHVYTISNAYFLYFIQDICSGFNWLHSLFLMHFREAKLPVHVQMERSGSSTYVTETSNLKDVKALIHLQEQYRAKAAQNILGAQARQKKQYDMKHNMNSTLKVGDKVLKENTRNKHRKGG